MKNFSVDKLALLSLLLLSAHPCFAGKIQCWVNDAGITECGNYTPPQYSQKGFVEYSKRGIKTKEVKRAPTQEEIAELERQEQEELKRQQQEKEDRQLLDIFSTERDIELARAAALNAIDGQIQYDQTILEGLKGNLEDLEKSYEFSKKNPDVSEKQLSAIARNITSVKEDIREKEETLQRRHNERAETNKKYDAYLERYQNIMRRGGLPPMRIKNEK